MLITGESGTGKELLARYVHEREPARARCVRGRELRGLPDTLLESALFGHVRGAFTGADRARKGLFEAADGGTLFLDEVGEMSTALQGKLLRVLQEGELRPVGSERTRSGRRARARARPTATCWRWCARARFREDLYYRLAVVDAGAAAAARRAPRTSPLLTAHFVEKHGGGRKRARRARRAMRALERRGPGPATCASSRTRCAVRWRFSDGEIELAHLTRCAELGSDSGRTQGTSSTCTHTPTSSRARWWSEALERADGNVTHAAALLGRVALRSAEDA